MSILTCGHDYILLNYPFHIISIAFFASITCTYDSYFPSVVYMFVDFPHIFNYFHQFLGILNEVLIDVNGFD